MNTKLVKYIEMFPATWPCNFRCHYCYVGQLNSDAERTKMDTFQHSPDEMAAALSMERLGGRALLNFCACGETLIPPQNVAMIQAMLKAGHFVMVVSNMTITKAVDELLALPPEYLERLFFKCSFHWLELKRLNLLDTFTENVNRAWKAGVSITVEITPSDELVPEIPEIKKYSMEHFGALPHITIARNENTDKLEILSSYPLDEYKKIWGQFDSKLFEFKMSIWGKKVLDFCYAGDVAYQVIISDGSICRCSGGGEKIGNIFAGGGGAFPYSPVGKRCPFPHCYNGHLYSAFDISPGNSLNMTYLDLRDRTRADKTHWVYPRMAQVFQSKPEPKKPGLWRRLFG